MPKRVRTRRTIRAWSARASACLLVGGSVGCGSQFTPTLVAPEAAAALSNPENKPDPRNQLAAPAMPGKNVPAIKVNTVGYPSGWQKLAILNQAPNDVRLLDERGNVVHRISPQRITDVGVDVASKDTAWRADFS